MTVDSVASRLMEGNHGIVGIVIATLFFGAALIFWFKKDSGKDNHDNAKIEKKPSETWSSAAAKTSATEAPINDNDNDVKVKEGSDSDTNSSQAKDNGDSGKLRNVFSVKQKPIDHGSGGKQASSDSKPFESSYYFAHNKHSTGGGYKDGLRAEDYVMNGPKLLSKGGVRVDEKPKNNDCVEDNNDSQEEESIPTATEQKDTKERPKQKITASTPITKYMWDDDGSGNNVAKIHIDSLPVSSTKTMKWEDAGILKDQVQVRLIGDNNEGLYIGIINEDDKRYHLHIPKMYGEAESIKSIVKKHKLLVKITKKKKLKRYSNRHSSDEGVWKTTTKALGKLAGGRDASSSEKEEYVSVAWPRLSASSVGGLGGGTADIDEKLFKEMDVKKQGESVGGGDDMDIMQFCK